MKTRTAFLTVLLTGLLVADALATDTYWQAATGIWDTDADWSVGEPTGSDNAYINNGGRCNLVYAGEVCDYLYVGYDTGCNTSPVCKIF